MNGLRTIDEAASELRKTPRWLSEWLRAHPVDGAGIPYCRKAGRDRLFTEGDLARILEALGSKLGLGRDATIAEAKQYIVNVVAQDVHDYFRRKGAEALAKPAPLAVT